MTAGRRRASTPEPRVRRSAVRTSTVGSGRSGSRLGGRRLLGSTTLLVVAFVLIHAALAAIDLFDTQANAMGDVTGVYRYWIDLWHSTHVLVGVGTDWVYPIGALPPMLFAGLLGDAAYGALWLLLVTVLDGVALLVLARTHRPAAWWWLLATAALGPVAIARIDGVALPVAIVGVVLFVRRPAVAAALFTVAAWIKVWPAALVLGMLLAVRRRSPVVAAAAATCAVVIGAALAVGARGTIFSFIAAQTGRSLQIEAPVSALWLWDPTLGVGDTTVYYDLKLLTYQLTGQGVLATAAAMTWVLAAGVVLVCVLGVLSVRRGADRGTSVALIALGVVTASIALNKVGSPQYFTWFVAPIVLGMVVAPGRFRVPAGIVVALDVLTQIIYPWGYTQVVSLDPVFLVVLDLRDLLEFVLLGWVLHALLTVTRAPTTMPAQREAASARATR